MSGMLKPSSALRNVLKAIKAGAIAKRDAARAEAGKRDRRALGALLRALREAAGHKASQLELPPLILAVLALQDEHAERLAAASAAQAAAMTKAREVTAAKAKCAAALKAGDPVTISYQGRVFTVERVNDHRQLCIRESRGLRVKPKEVRPSSAPLQVAA